VSLERTRGLGAAEGPTPVLEVDFFRGLAPTTGEGPMDLRLVLAPMVQTSKHNEKERCMGQLLNESCSQILAQISLLHVLQANPIDWSFANRSILRRLLGATVSIPLISSTARSKRLY